MARPDRATWAKRVERWKDSGLSAAKFAAELGISPNSLSWWRWQLGKQDAAPQATTPKKRAARAGKARRVSRPQPLSRLARAAHLHAPLGELADQ